MMGVLCARILCVVLVLLGIALIFSFFGSALAIAFGSSLGQEFGCEVFTSLKIPSAKESSTSSEPPLPNPPPASLTRAREKRWEDEEEDLCRFPSFMNQDKTHYNMSVDSYVMEYGDHLRKGHFRHRLKNARRRHASSFSAYNRTTNIVGTKSISFLHVGKAGGSSLSCNIRAAIPYVTTHCPHYSPDAKTIVGFPLGGIEGELSKMVNCYVHYDNWMHCFDNPTLAINIRNPIDRLASWFHYEHIENKKVIWGSQAKTTCGQQMLFKCYNSFSDLAEYGLSGDRPPPTQLLHIKSNSSEEVCRHWAWAVVQGTAPASFHNVWNYDWYGSPALAFRKEIIVFRTEHIQEDWKRVDILLGGNGTVPPEMHANDANRKGISVNNRTISEQGRLNLCRALCHEIQVYKQLMTAAINLDEIEVIKSLKELNCPGDLNVNIRFCTQNYFDYAK